MQAGMSRISNRYHLQLSPQEMIKAFKEADWDYSQVRTDHCQQLKYSGYCTNSSCTDRY